MHVQHSRIDFKMKSSIFLQNPNNRFHRTDNIRGLGAIFSVVNKMHVKFQAEQFEIY